MSEVCRNLSCTGAEPLALTDCLNFGNPERPDIYYQLEGAIRGMARACRVLGVPVISGNVSLYNESQGQAIYPTPIVGGLGLLEDVGRHTRSSFPGTDLAVFLLGQAGFRSRASDLAGSEYLHLVHEKVAGRPAIDLSLERRVQSMCRQAIALDIIVSAHDCSDGGLAVALAECCIPEDVGFRAVGPLARPTTRWDCALFGERQSRIIVSLPSKNIQGLRTMASEMDVPLLELGRTGGSRFRLGRQVDLSLSEIAHSWNGGLEQALGN